MARCASRATTGLPTEKKRCPGASDRSIQPVSLARHQPGSSAIPHCGQVPGPCCRTSGCIGHVYSPSRLSRNRRGRVVWRQKRSRVFPKLCKATIAAEGVGVSLEIDVPNCSRGRDRHSADGVEHLRWGVGGGVIVKMSFHSLVSTCPTLNADSHYKGASHPASSRTGQVASRANPAAGRRLSCKTLNDGFPSSSKRDHFTDITVSSGSFVRPITHAGIADAEIVVVPGAQLQRAAGFERDGPVAVPFQLILPVFASSGRASDLSSSIGSMKRALMVTAQRMSNERSPPVSLCWVGRWLCFVWAHDCD